MKYSLILLVSILVVTVSGCKKSKESKPACLLTVVTPERGDVINFYYDSERRVRMIKQNVYTFECLYKGDSIVILQTQYGAFKQRFRSRLNAQGLPQSVRLEENESGNKWYLYEFEYSGTEVQKQTFTTYLGTTPSITNYVWSNGNMISQTSGNLTRKYEYFTDEPHRQGDAFMYEDPLEFGGLVIVNNKNLVKKMEYTLTSVGTYSNFYEYRFDKDGKVLTMLKSSNDNPDQLQQDMQYQCN